jgi:hypothetical protein
MKYSVEEIDALRSATKALIEARTMHADRLSGCAKGEAYYPDERANQVERELRTYMINGTTVEEIQARIRQEKERLDKELDVMKQEWGWYPHPSDPRTRVWRPHSADLAARAVIYTERQ